MSVEEAEEKPPGPTRTSYDGPITTVTLSIAGRPIRLVRPSDPDRLLEAPDVLSLNAQDDYMPYWAYLWPGAFLLGESIAQRAWPEETPALEIGCGLGLAGLMGIRSGLDVTFSDYDRAPLEFVALSAQANGFVPRRWSTLSFDWRDPPEASYPVILAADVLYEKRLVPLVASVLARMLSPNGVALIAGPYRVATEDFPAALARHGLTTEPTSVSVAESELGPLRGTLHQVRWV